MTPQLEALLVCNRSEPDDGGSTNIYGVMGEIGAKNGFPTRLDATLFARFRADVQSCVTTLQLVRVGDERILQEQATTSSSPSDFYQAIAPLSIRFDRPGVYALRLLVDGVVIGDTRLTVFDARAV